MESESTPREYVVLPSRVLSIQLACGHLESVVHASYKYYLAWLPISMKLRMPMPRRGSVSVTMHVNSGVRTLNPASCLTYIWGVADAGVATQHGVVTIRTATALPEKEGVEMIQSDGGLRPTGLASLDRQSKPNMPLQWLPMVIITY